MAAVAAAEVEVAATEAATAEVVSVAVAAAEVVAAAVAAATARAMEIYMRKEFECVGDNSRLIGGREGSHKKTDTHFDLTMQNFDESNRQ